MRSYSLRRFLTVALTFALVLACFQFFAGSAYAISAPAKVKSLKASALGTVVTLKWAKASGANGYEIKKNGKVLKKTTKLQYTDKKCTAGKTYNYNVRAYKKYKQYYNSKTKKWVDKKPAKKYWKGKKTRTAYKYGKTSKVSITIKKSVTPAAGTLYIGGIGPLSGPVAQVGSMIDKGARLAAEEINASNEVHVKWNMYDDAASAEKAQNGYSELRSDGMQVLVGTVTGISCAAVAATAYEDRTFMMTPTASTASLTDGKDNFFQFCSSDSLQGTMAAEYIAQKYPDAVIGVIYNSADDWSAVIYEAFSKACEKAGKNIVTASIEDDFADCSTQVSAMKDAGVDMLFMPLYYYSVANVLEKSKDLNYSPIVFGADGMDGILDMENFDTSLVEGALIVCPFTANTEKAAGKAFVSAFKEKYGVEPTVFAAKGYDAVYAVYNAFGKAGCKTTDSRQTICEAMVSVFHSNSFMFSGVTGTNMKWNESNMGDMDPAICVIRNGQYYDAD